MGRVLVSEEVVVDQVGSNNRKDKKYRNRKVESLARWLVENSKYAEGWAESWSEEGRDAPMSVRPSE